MPGLHVALRAGMQALGPCAIDAAKLRAAQCRKVAVVNDVRRVAEAVEGYERRVDRARLGVVVAIVNAPGEIEHLGR